jgi:hypothetical protein
MEEKGISAAEVRLIIERGIRTPEAADAGASPRFSYRAMIEGRWVTVVAAEEIGRIVVITVIAGR